MVKCSKCGKPKAKHHFCDECFGELLQLLAFSEPLVREHELRMKKNRKDLENTQFSWKPRKPIVAKKLTLFENCTKQLAELGNPKLFADGWKYVCLVDVQPRRNQIVIFEDNRRKSLMCTALTIEHLLELKNAEYSRTLYMIRVCPQTNMIIDIKA